LLANRARTSLARLPGPLLSPRGPLLSLGALALLLITLAGCGSSVPAGTNADPALVVPAAAPLYIGATVTPSGSLKQEAISVGQRLTHSSTPFTGLLEVLRGGSGPKLDYVHDVKPWLGAQAGLFVDSIDASASSASISSLMSSGLSGGLSGLLGANGLGGLLRAKGVQGALVLDTSNPVKALSFLQQRAHDEGAHSASYRGVSYQVGSAGTAWGIVGRYAVIGSEAGLKSVTDSYLGAASLAHATSYTQLAAKAEAGSLAHLYIDPDALLAGITNQGKDASLLGFAHQLLASAKQAYVSLLPQANSLVLDADYLPSSSKAPSATAKSGAEVLSGLPGESWLAIGIGDLGATLGHSSQGIRALASLGANLSLGSFSLKGLLAPFGSPKLEPQRDLLSWMGSAGIFASGNGLLNLKLGIVIDSKNPALSRAAVAKLANAYRATGAIVAPTSVPGTEAADTIKLQGFPLVLTMADGQGKFVIGLGAASIAEALNPQSTLSGSASYATAAKALGGGAKPSVIVELPTLVGLLESVGLNQAPGISTIVPYLQALGTITAGGEQLGGGVKRSRVVIGLQPSG
jgi:Protein of unknown function (DUF3352)